MPFSIPFASEEEVYDIISSFDTTKGSGYDTIPTKLIQMSAGVITKPITSIVNLTIQTGTYPELLKTATVSPVFKKEDPLSKENFRPISVLTVFLKDTTKINYYRTSTESCRTNFLLTEKAIALSTCS